MIERLPSGPLRPGVTNSASQRPLGAGPVDFRRNSEG